MSQETKQVNDPLMGFWLTTPNFQFAEMLAVAGFRRLILDVEHGPFGHETLHNFIPACKGLGLEVFVKVLAPERSPIQTVLDFGADGVMIPHLQNLDHAREVCAYAKFPSTGDRSLAGGRAMRYRMPTDDWFEQTNQRIRCFAMIETAGALADAEGIAALPCVDGLFPGPTDLSVRRGRGMYKRTPDDWQDIESIAHACRNNGKALVLPAWSAEERRRGITELGASFVFSGLEMLEMGRLAHELATGLKNEATSFAMS
ncbi:MAG: aldolase/citrate lyase family protein [Hydrogenophaga sp.]|nr:aldolase/citrate lyase family protein [Hydrogenophaga sp.]